MTKQKIILILPAYNNEKTLHSFLGKLPDLFDEIILVDDCSQDKTFSLASKIKSLKVYQTPRNLGYGGNLKMCLGIALEKGADIIIELHPDGEYDVDGIKPALKEITKGARLVLGKRINPLQSGMYFWKYIFIRFLNAIDNALLGTKISDLHQGFRVYTKELLQEVNFRNNSNDYLFSFEIIVQTVLRKLTIAEVPVKNHYRGRKRGASLKASILYGLKTFLVIFKFILAKIGLNISLFSKPQKKITCLLCNLSYLVEHRYKVKTFDIYYCNICQTSFLFPQPKDLNRYYPAFYWNYPGLIGQIKNIIYDYFQSRRKLWLLKYQRSGNILDIGAGEGKFGKSLDNNFKVTSIEAPFAILNNRNIIKTDFLKWQIKQKFEAITFWESLEHVPNPQRYLEKAAKLLKKNGLIFIEYPLSNCFEAKLFGRYWFHLDPPRHLFHFTKEGLNIILSRVGLKKIEGGNVLALEYSPFGFIASFLTLSPLFILFLPLFIIAIIFEIIMWFICQSPISLIIAKKE
jgi:glycosyltransferase involved in cell wall biosynthesis